MLEEIPGYLGRESASERKMMARFRRGNEERESRHCMEEEEKSCRIYINKTECLFVYFVCKSTVLLRT
jgi:hypothetical protein